MRLNTSILLLILQCITAVSIANEEISIKKFLGMMQSLVDESEKQARIMYEDRKAWCTKWAGVSGPFSFDRYKETVQFLMESDKTNRIHHPLFITEGMKAKLETYKKRSESSVRAVKKELKVEAQETYRLFKFLCESTRVEEETSN